MESARALREARVKLQQEMAARNSANLPLSGFAIQALVRLYVAHIDRCTTARFDSYEQAYAETGGVISEQDLAQVMTDFKAVRAQEIRHSTRAVKEFIRSRGPVGASADLPEQLLDSGSAENHDRLLARLKIWRAKPQLKLRPAPGDGGRGADEISVEDEDRRFAAIAIEEARKSVAEDGRPHPRVGAVVVKDGKVLSTAHRGETLKSHAEYVALDDKLSDDLIAGATVYTTLEPCTTRNHPKIPCAQRLIDRKVRRVVIGMLDPNPEIRGRGDQLLSDAGIEVQLFPRDLRAQVEEMNRDFIRAQKQRQTAIGSEAVESDPKEFWEQRKKLPETQLLRKIRSKPYWHVWIRPTEFKRARFQNVARCRDFILSSEVIIQGWFSYPYFSPQTIEVGDEWIAGEIEHSETTLYRAERWALFRSGQFVHSRSLDEIAQVGDRVHALEVLDTATAAFEFAARMAEQRALTPLAAITFELRGVAGRGLTWPQDRFGYTDGVGPNCWCQDETLRIERRATPEELVSRARELALDCALEIYAKFGWVDPPKERLAAEQLKRFGPR